MKYVMLGDTHLGVHNDSEIWHKVVLDLFKEICDYCTKNDIKTIIHGGDFFHNRKHINVKTIQIGIEIIELLKDLQLIIITGNHDTYFKNSIQPTSLEIFKEYKQVKIIDEPTKFNNILLVPWMGDPNKIKANYCFGHFEISGFHMNDNYVCKKGYNSNQFSQFKQTYSSHFHTPSRQGNITYLGSPYQQTFHDVDGKRGYYIWEDGKLEFIEFHKYPKFHKVSTNDKINKELIEGNIIKLIFEKDYGTNENEKLVNKVKSFNPLNFKVDFSHITDDSVEITSRDEVLSLINHDEIIIEFIKKSEQPTNIKKEVLTKISNNMIKEIKGDK